MTKLYFKHVVRSSLTKRKIAARDFHVYIPDYLPFIFFSSSSSPSPPPTTAITIIIISTSHRQQQNPHHLLTTNIPGIPLVPLPDINCPLNILSCRLKAKFCFPLNYLTSKNRPFCRLISYVSPRSPCLESEFLASGSTGSRYFLLRTKSAQYCARHPEGTGVWPSKDMSLLPGFTCLLHHLSAF